MANGGRIDYTVGFKTDKSGLNQLKSSLQEIKALTAQDLMKIGGHNDIKKANDELEQLKTSIGLIDGALEKAFNADLGTLNISKFNQELKNLPLKSIYKDFSNAGATGQAAFRNITAQVLTTNMQLKQTHKFLDEMATTMANTIKWGVASSLMNNFTGSVQQAYGYVKSLDSSLNDIRIVTGASAEEMDKFAVKANNAAKALGKSTTDYTDAALIYYQQGLSEEDVAARAETTLKAANVTGQSGEAVSEQLTAVWNGYKVNAQEAELYVDKLAAVAATTASDLEELSVGMSKVASAAELMGVPIDSLNAQMATIISVTRQAPESVGTALKTIYARMGDIEAGLDGETSLGEYTEQMASMGVDVLDASGNLRDMGEVIEEIGGKWSSMSREQQLSLSQTMAGTRQYNNLLALFDNWDMYTDALNTSANAAGTLQQQQDTYMESTQAHLNQLRAASEDLYDSLLDPKGINPLIDGLTTVTNLFSNFVDSVGGGSGVLLNLGAIGSQVFSKQIASGLVTTIANMQAVKHNTQQLNAEMQILGQFENLKIDDTRTQRLIEMKRQQLDLTKSLTDEERNISNEYIKQQNELYKEQDALENRINAATEAYSQLTGKNIDFKTADEDAINKASLEFKDKGDFELGEADKLKDNLQLYQELTHAAQTYRSVANTGSGDLQKAMDAQTEAVKKNQLAINSNLVEAEKLRENDKIATESKKELIIALDEFYDLTKGGSKINLSNLQHVQALEKVEKARIKTHQLEGQAYKQKSEEVKRFTIETNNNKTAVETLTQRWNNFIKTIDLRNSIQQFTTMIGKVGQIASGINSLKQIPTIFNNEDISTGEKILQITTSLTMEVPMLINGIMGTISSYGILLTKLKEYIGLEALKNSAVMKSIGVERARNIQEALILSFQSAGIKLTKEEIKSLDAKTARQLIKDKLDKGEITNRQAISLATKLNIIDREMEGKTIAKNILLKLKDIAIMVGPYVLAFGLVTAGVWALVKSYNAEADAAREAAEVANTLADAYQHVKEKQDNFNNSLNAYNEAVDAVKELKDEMDGYEESIEKANEQALELIENNKELAQFASRGKDGLIIFDTKELEKYQEKQEKILNNADFAKNQSKIAANNASMTAGIAKLGRTTGFYTTTEERPQWQGIDEGTVTTLSNIYEEHGNILHKDIDTLVENGKISESLGRSIKANLEEGIIPLIQSNLELKAANEFLASEIAGVTLGEVNEDYTNRSATEQALIASAMGQVSENDSDYQAAYDKAYSEALSKYQYGLGVDETNLHNAYAEAMGYDSIRTKDQIGKATFYNTDGTEAVAGITDAAMAMTLASQEASKAMMDSSSIFYQTAVQSAEKIGTLGNSLGEGLGDKLQGFTSSGSFEGQNLSSEDISSLKGISKEDLDGIDVSQWGYDTAQEYIEALNTALESYETEEKKAEFEKAPEKYDLDTEELESFRELLKDSNSDLEENQELLNEASIAGTRFSKGLDKMGSNWEDFNEVMSDSNASIEDLYKVLPDVNSALQDMLDYSDEEFSMLPPDFAQKHWDKIQDVVDGVDGAYEDLLALAAEEIIFDLGLDPSAQEELTTAINGITDVIDVQDLEVGATLDDTGFTDVLNQMILNGQATASDISAALEAIQFNPEISYEEVDVNTVQFDKQTGTAEVIDPITGDVRTVTAENIHNFAADGKVRIPTINGSTTTYKGPSSGARSGGSPKKSSGGGGGGGGGSTPKKTYKQTEKKKDRYHDVENKLTKLSTQMGRLTEEQDKLYGSELIDNLNKQLDIIKEQVKATKEKLSIAKQEAEEMRTQRLAQQESGYYNDLLDFGVKFDENGEITNALALMEQWDNKVKSLHDQWNALSAAQQEATNGENLTKAIEQAEANRDTLHSLIESYDALIYETIPELQDEITQMAYQQIELKIEVFNVEAEVHLDLTEAIKDWDDFQKDLNETLNLDVDTSDILEQLDIKVEEGVKTLEGYSKLDEATLNTSALIDLKDSKLIKSLAEDLDEKLVEYSKVQNGEISKLYSATIDDTGRFVSAEQLAREDIQETLDNLKESILDVVSYQEELQENYLDSIDKISEEIDKAIEQYENINDTLEHNLNMIDLLAGENANAQKIEAYDRMILNNKVMLETQYAAAEYYRQMYEAETQDMEARQAWLELWQDSMSDVNSTVEEQTELLMEKLQTAVAAALDTMNDSLTGNKGLSFISKEWEMNTRVEESYLDGVNRMYSIQSLENKIRESINSTDSLSAQRKLNKLMDEELKKLREKDKLTQYDVDRANQLYEIELKRIALEEAQQNKAQMRLRRDSSGNYSYQFVADEDSISKAQQELDNAQNSLYNMDKEQFKTTQEEFLNIYQEYQDYVVEYSQMSLEEQLSHEQEFKDTCADYLELLTGLNENFNISEVNLRQSTTDALKLLYDENSANFNEMTQTQIDSLVNEFMPAFSSSMEEMMELVGKTDENGTTGLQAAWEKTNAAILEARNNTIGAVEDIEKVLGMNDKEGLTKLQSDYYEKVLNGSKDVIDKQNELIEKAKAEVIQIGYLKDAVEELIKTWLKAESAGGKAMEAITDAYLTLMGKKTEQEEEIIEAPKIEETKVEEPPKPVEVKPEKTTISEKTLTKGDTVTVKKSATRWSRDGGNGTKMSSWVPGSKFTVNKINGDEVLLYKNNSVMGWVNKKDLEGFATGGYTGEWGKDGKIAMLHEKELVLNAKDTENMLTMIKFIREIVAQNSLKKSNAREDNLGKVSYELQEYSSNLLHSLLLNTDSLLEFCHNINLIFENSDFYLMSIFDKVSGIERGLQLSLTDEEILNSFEGFKNHQKDTELLFTDSLKQQIALTKEVVLNKELDLIKTDYNSILKDVLKSQSGTTENRFEVYADFPNATNGEEIVEALLDLPNIANQYIYSSNR